MCRQVTDSRRGNRFIYAFMILSVVFAAGLVYAAEMPTPVDAAERVGKMSAIGVLAFGFLTSLASNAYLIKLQFGRWLAVVDKNTEVMQKVVDAIEKCNRAK